jgi:ParB-like chromosome segregation protein Spo0J
MKLTLETRPVSSLRVYEKNSKKHGDEDVTLILASIRQYGFNDPIGIMPDGLIVEGHGRLQAAQILGMTDVPVLVLHEFTNDQADLYRIAHNKITLSTSFDFELLAAAFHELVTDTSEFTYNSLGFVDEIAENVLRMFDPEAVRTGRGGRPVPQEYDVIWETEAQKKRFARLMRGLHDRYPDLGEGEALVRFLSDTGLGAQDTATETEGGNHVSR